jgi:hypothetical protein
VAFEDFFVALRDNHFGKLRRKEALQPPDSAQFFDLLRDPRFETAVEFGYFLGAAPKRLFHQRRFGAGPGHQQRSWALSPSSSIRLSGFLLFPFGLC